MSVREVTESPRLPAVCNLCGEPVAPGRAVRWVKDGFDIVSCPACGLLFRRELPSAAELEEIYALDYFKRPPGERGAQGYCDYVEDEEVRRIDARRRLALLSRHVVAGRLLDVGCASGFFLDEARTAGWTVKGVDLAPAMTTLARERFHLEVETASFQAVDLADPALDCVTMWDYLEHSCDPMSDLRKAFASLRPGGVLALSTGDAGAVVARIFGSRWHLLTPRHHNFFFTRRHLARMLGDIGFQRVETRYEPRQPPLRSLAYKLQTLAPRSRIVRTASDRLGRSQLGSVTVKVNMFDIVTIVARRPRRRFPAE
jgi:SAM-dependent methyltransferase